MRISDWSSDVCSSDLPFGLVLGQGQHGRDGFALRKRQEVDHRSAARRGPALGQAPYLHAIDLARGREEEDGGMRRGDEQLGDDILVLRRHAGASWAWRRRRIRSEEHTSELQSLMRISYAVFCLKKKKQTTTQTPPILRIISYS